MKFSIKDFFIKCKQISSFLRIWLHLLKKSLVENFIFCAVWVTMIPNNLGFHQDYQLVVFQANYLNCKKLFTFLKLIFYQENKIKFLPVELV